MELAQPNCNVPKSFINRVSQFCRYPTRVEVERANCSKLDALNSPAFRYDATDTPGIDSYGKEVSDLQMQSLLDRLVAPRSLLLKVRVITLTVCLCLTRAGWRTSHAHQGWFAIFHDQVAHLSFLFRISSKVIW